MPDIPNRDALEAKIARLLGKYNRRQLAKVRKQLGNPPNLHNLPQEFWDDAVAELGEILIPFMEEVYLESAERLWQTQR
jgi:hypothetical protein